MAAPTIDLSFVSTQLRADETVRKRASLRIQQCTARSAVAQRVIGVCAKDSICSEAKYHSSCFKAFVRIHYTIRNTREDEGSNDCDHDLKPDAVCSFCEGLIAKPRVIEFKKSGNNCLTRQANWASVFQTHIAKTSCEKCQIGSKSCNLFLTNTNFWSTLPR